MREAGGTSASHLDVRHQLWVLPGQVAPDKVAERPRELDAGGPTADDAEVQRLPAVLLGRARQRGQLKGLPDAPAQPHRVRHLLRARPAHMSAVRSEQGSKGLDGAAAAQAWAG